MRHVFSSNSSFVAFGLFRSSRCAFLSNILIIHINFFLNFVNRFSITREILECYESEYRLVHNHRRYFITGLFVFGEGVFLITGLDLYLLI